MSRLFCTKFLIRTGLARLLPRVRRLGGETASYLHYYSDRVLTAPLSQLTEAARFLEIPGPDGIDLALGSPRWDLVPSARTWLPADRRGLPQPGGVPQLRRAVGDFLAAEQGLMVPPDEEVLVTTGAAGALAAALEAFLNPGAPVVLFDPTSLLYPLLVRQRGARIRWVPTTMESGRIRVPFDQLARAMRRARLLILPSPASPTGGVFKPEDAEQIGWWANRRDVVVLEDRAFDRFQYEGERSHLGGLPSTKKRTLTAGSLSKGHGLAWARVGWLTGPQALIAACTLTATLQVQVVPTVCQELACTALGQDPKGFAGYKSELAGRRQYAFDRLQALGLEPVWPAGAFFLWLRVSQLGLDGEAFADRLLREKKVLAWPGSFFGPSGRGHVRLSYLTDEGRLREGLARIGELAQEMRDDPPRCGARAARAFMPRPTPLGSAH
jgi:aminotransferase